MRLTILCHPNPRLPLTSKAWELYDMRDEDSNKGAKHLSFTGS